MKTLSLQEEQILLAVHRLGDRAYLIPIREEIKIYTGRYFSVGTIFAPLSRLKNNGYLESHLGEPNSVRGGRAIRYYKITAKGYQALRDIKKVHERMWAGIVIPDTRGDCIK
jgi:DNA-binding PadR family transcriptional regulator